MLKRAHNRVSFKKKEEIIDIPNLIEVQLKSYRDFLQEDLLPSERRNIGIQEVFNTVFPVRSNDDKIILEYISYSLGKPKYSPMESIRKGITYQGSLKVKFRLTDETGVKEEEVYMGSIPFMTENGTFVVNGVERVVVSQLHRSPGIFFEEERHSKSGVIYSFRIIPYRGSWLEAAFDSTGVVYIYVDRKKRRRKILATSFIRALGYSSDSDIIAEFFPVVTMTVRLEKDFPKCVGKILAEDVTDPSGSTVFGVAGEKLTTAMLKRIIDSEIETIKIAEGADDHSPIIKMLGKDPTDCYEAALKDFYRKIRPGEPVSLSSARSAMMRLFFDPKRYNLGKVGRYKIDQKLHGKFSSQESDVFILNAKDIIQAIQYLIRLKSGDSDASVDDIDHLGNRRVRSVGELVQNQFRIGLIRTEKTVKDRINSVDWSMDVLTPGKIVSIRGAMNPLRDFFARSPLSQLLDETNPLAAITHKRRLSALGPGGLSQERAGFDVRDVHSSHYGRVCPTETSEGANIGLVVSLASYSKINEFGFIETPYLVVKEGLVTDEIEYKTASQEENCVIAEASTPLDEYNMFVDSTCFARHKGDFNKVSIADVTHMDASPRQLVSVATGLIPFLEHDDVNRALMGSNMQRQAVPLLIREAPVVGTGLESRIAKDSGVLCIAKEAGKVEYVDASQVVVATSADPSIKRRYSLKKFMRSNAGTYLNQTPICEVGDKIQMGDVLADGPATDRGELALGKNVLVAYMPWKGYNYEDAIVVSDKLFKEDAFTSIHIEEFEIAARDTKLGKEEITRDIPNIPDSALANLGPDGIIRIGAEVKPGDILVGKVTPKSETELAPEERLLRAIFGEKAADVSDASLVVPPGTEGVVIEVKVFSRKDHFSRTEDELIEETRSVKQLYQEYKNKEIDISIKLHEQLGALLLGEPAPDAIMDRNSGDLIVAEGAPISVDTIEILESTDTNSFIWSDRGVYKDAKRIIYEHTLLLEQLKEEYKLDVDRVHKGDVELKVGITHQVKVYIGIKRRLLVGDKMAGRHGNKGVVSIVVPEADMPCLADGRAIEMIFNPLGVPSRMNIGQIFETNLGYAAKEKGIHVQVPVFEGCSESQIETMQRDLGLSEDGKAILFDGQTGERFEGRVVVGCIYVMKLNHLVTDKVHARSTGPYSLVTQQPLGGKAQQGGQRFGEMEVWALEAYGAANLLQEMLTVKSDDVVGRGAAYDGIVNNNNVLNAGTPESYNVLIREMQGLCLDVTVN